MTVPAGRLGGSPGAANGAHSAVNGAGRKGCEGHTAFILVGTRSRPGARVPERDLDSHTLSAGASGAWHATTILMVRKGARTVMGGDGQVSMGQTVIKHNARKVRRLAKGAVIAGFAGATADAFALFERLEQKLEQHPGQLARACVEMAKDWRTDRYLRRLEAMMLVTDGEVGLVLSGNGDVLEPQGDENGWAIAIGSGGNYALAAARALLPFPLDAEEIVRRSMSVAADICVYTNANLVVDAIDSPTLPGLSV